MSLNEILQQKLVGKWIVVHESNSTTTYYNNDGSVYDSKDSIIFTLTEQFSSKHNYLNGNTGSVTMINNKSRKTYKILDIKLTDEWFDVYLDDYPNKSSIYSSVGTINCAYDEHFLILDNPL